MRSEGTKYVNPELGFFGGWVREDVNDSVNSMCVENLRWKIQWIERDLQLFKLLEGEKKKKKTKEMQSDKRQEWETHTGLQRSFSKSYNPSGWIHPEFCCWTKIITPI